MSSSHGDRGIAFRAAREGVLPGFRSILAVLFLVALCPAAVAGSVSSSLRSALDLAGPDDRLPVVVLMAEHPGGPQLLEQVQGMNRARRRALVVSTLRELAERSQANVRSLIARERTQDQVSGFQVLWGVNGLALEATPGAIERLAALPEVLWVLYDRAPARPDAEPDSSPEGSPDGDGLPGPNPNATVAPDVVALGAKQVWDQLGYTGMGVVVAVIDTGLDRTHPDLSDHIWSNPDEIPTNGLDDDHNGHVDDTWGWDFCADSQPVVGTHGTQVAGQVAGDGTNGTVCGMAPDARLMSLGIDCDTPSRAWAASDYAIAEGADLITQSYSWWWTDRPNYAGFRRQGDVELAAGVIHANSAGNNGGSYTNYPIPYNISTPANVPAPWLHPDQALAGGISSVVAVGNITCCGDSIAASSSIGPSAWEAIRANTDPTYPYENPPEYRDYPYENGAQMGLIKPDIAAYGNGTNSTCPGGYYCQFSGTSSATPHVSGAIALMLQSNPEATPQEVAEALMTTARHLGTPGKNNVYGAGMLQAYPAVLAVESGVVYKSHAIDDAAQGNGDLRLDPGETVVMRITVESRTDAPIDGLEAILSSATPGVTIHDRYAIYPTLPARGTATSLAPHFSLSIDPAACTTILYFDLELRYSGKVRRSTFAVRVGEDEPVILLDDDFESDLGWTSDHGAATQGYWVRQDPIGVRDGQSRLANPEDDTSPAGTACYVTGNGELSGRKDENNNDVDGGAVILLSPPFGRQHMLSMTLSYDRWYYDVSSGNTLRVEVSNDGGLGWTLLEQLIYDDGGWVTRNYDLSALLPPSDNMRLRFRADDDFSDDAVEAAVDEVRVEGVWVDCQAWTPPALRRPNPVGDTLGASADPAGHVVLTWSPPPVDAGHDAATLYRVLRASGAAGSLGRRGLRDLHALGGRGRASHARTLLLPRHRREQRRHRVKLYPVALHGGSAPRAAGSWRAAAGALAACVLAAALPVHGGSVAPNLGKVLASAGPDERVPVVILMQEFPAQGQLLDEVRGMSREQRRTHVVSTLQALAERSQLGVRALLHREPGAARVVRVLWGVNGLALQATPATIARLAELPEVRWVLHDGGHGEPADGTGESGESSEPGTAGGGPATGPTGGDTSGPNPNATIRGEVTAMGAPQVWNDLGYTGAGVIVAVLDTGVYRNHPDLADHIWTNLDEIPGNGIDDDANGYVDDTWGWDLCNHDNEPTSGSHGTQVAGQVAGDGTNGVVTGMAPDAELMVLGFDCSPPDSIGWEASDYAIANGAHVITESFIWPWEDPPDYEGWRRQADTELAAGILHLNAAGNDGQNTGTRPVPYNVGAPGNCPPPWLHPEQALAGGISSVVTVANIDYTTNTLTPSSSRGPSAWEDIVAWSNPAYPWPLTPGYMDYPYHDGAEIGTAQAGPLGLRQRDHDHVPRHRLLQLQRDLVRDAARHGDRGADAPGEPRGHAGGAGPSAHDDRPAAGRAGQEPRLRHRPGAGLSRGPGRRVGGRLQLPRDRRRLPRERRRRARPGRAGRAVRHRREPDRRADRGTAGDPDDDDAGDHDPRPGRVLPDAAGARHGGQPRPALLAQRRSSRLRRDRDLRPRVSLRPIGAPLELPGPRRHGNAALRSRLGHGVRRRLDLRSRHRDAGRVDP